MGKKNNFLLLFFNTFYINYVFLCKNQTLALFIFGYRFMIKFVGSEFFFIAFSVFKYVTCVITVFSNSFFSSGVFKRLYTSNKFSILGTKTAFSLSTIFSCSNLASYSSIELFNLATFCDTDTLLDLNISFV